MCSLSTDRREKYMFGMEEKRKKKDEKLGIRDDDDTYGCRLGQDKEKQNKKL